MIQNVKVDSLTVFLLNCVMTVTRTKVRHELYRQGALGTAFLMLISTTLGSLDGAKLATSFLIISGICWFYVLSNCHGKLHLNFDPKSKRHFKKLGLGNHLTLARGLLIGATAGFIGTDPSTLSKLSVFFPAIFYTIAAIGDALDGYFSRVKMQTTQLGSELDNELDAFGLFIAPVLAVLWGKLHFTYLSVSAAFYVFRLGIYLRNHQGKPVYELAPNRFRRRLAGYQMSLVATSLWAPIPAELTKPVGFLLMIPLLIRFLLDWLQTSGRIKKK